MPKTALVTGSAGFVGRGMTRHLQENSWEVWGYDLVNGDDFLEKIDGLWKALDLVVHCAYHVGGRSGIDGYNTNFAKNLQLDAALFQWAVRTRQKRVLYFSSSAVYPVSVQQKKGHQVLEENLVDLESPRLPDANYGWAKLTGERLAADARRNGLAVSVVRPFSGYGAGQANDYPFPAIVKRASEGNFVVWGPPGQTRDWIHISDVIRGALSVVESGTTDPVNLCTGRGVTMADVMRIAAEECGQIRSFRSLDVLHDADKPTGVFYRVGDPRRLEEYYTPKVSLEEGVTLAVNEL